MRRRQLALQRFEVGFKAGMLQLSFSLAAAEQGRFVSGFIGEIIKPDRKRIKLMLVLKSCCVFFVQICFISWINTVAPI